MQHERIKGSFRDPSGFVYSRDGVLFRQVNSVYQAEYDQLIETGLAARLISANLLIPHHEVDLHVSSAYRTLQPDRVPFISYPYEWSFGELKDAALVTLQIQDVALNNGFTLKDASAFNIQFVSGKPLLIDTLSFERYVEGTPWIAYRQFCQHFLAPLLLMAYRDIRFGLLSRTHIDGIPLDLAAMLLPRRARFNFSVLAHIVMHARAQSRYSSSTKTVGAVGVMPKKSLLALISDLQTTIEKLQWRPEGTEWADYYDATNYTDEAESHKRTIVDNYLERTSPAAVWDLGGNTGVYSRIASSRNIPVICFDIDPAAVEKNYRTVRSRNETHILPLVMDLTNPSPNLGWAGEERDSLEARGPVDLAMALALIHHLAIGNNVPLEVVAEYMSKLCRRLVIEFVPKTDSQVQRLLASRKDIFDNYDIASFEAAFARHFNVEERTPVKGSERTLYLMRRKHP